MGLFTVAMGLFTVAMELFTVAMGLTWEVNKAYFLT
jgi:hypothetical protein